MCELGAVFGLCVKSGCFLYVKTRLFWCKSAELRYGLWKAFNVLFGLKNFRGNGRVEVII